jgi:hypothetical protein
MDSATTDRGSGSRAFLAPALVLDFFATALVIAGVVVYVNAPQGASAKTALIIPGVAAVALWIAGAFTLAGLRNARIGRKGYAIGLALCVLLVGLIGTPAFMRHRAMENRPAALEAWQAAVAEGRVKDDADAKAAFFRERKASVRDVGYLVTGLWTMAGLSVVATGAMLGVRPRVRGA